MSPAEAQEPCRVLGSPMLVKPEQRLPGKLGPFNLLARRKDVGAAQEHSKRRCTQHVRHDSRSQRRHRAADDRRVNIPPKCSFRPRGIKSDELGRGPETALWSVQDSAFRTPGNANPPNTRRHPPQATHRPDGLRSNIGEAPPGVGGTHSGRRTIEQAHTEPSLQVSHLLAGWAD